MEVALTWVILPLFGFVSVAAWHQSAIGQTSTSSLPSVSKTSAANAAGILRYCRESDLISGDSAVLLAKTVTHTDQTSVD